MDPGADPWRAIAGETMSSVSIITDDTYTT
jgi:hypothetical protein